MITRDLRTSLFCVLCAGCGLDTLVLADIDASVGHDAEQLPPDATAPEDGGVFEDASFIDASPVEDAAPPLDAFVPPAPEDAGPGASDAFFPTCASNADCPAAYYCEKPACDTPIGVCMPRLRVCSGEPSPVCGCNGVTYYNDCMRKSEGVSLGGLTECIGTIGNALDCNSATPCPSGAYCAFLAFDDVGCDLFTFGTCWVLPSECGRTGFGGDLFSACGAPDTCVDACTAIKSGTPHVLQRRCGVNGNPNSPPF